MAINDQVAGSAAADSTRSAERTLDLVRSDALLGAVLRSLQPNSVVVSRRRPYRRR